MFRERELDDDVREALCDSIEVTWGEEYFQPLQYHGLRVGPFKATVQLRAGETVIEATKRMHRALAEAARQVFAEKLTEYTAKIGETQQAVARYR